jgi:hypothetical protein
VCVCVFLWIAGHVFVLWCFWSFREQNLFEEYYYSRSIHSDE